LAEADVHRIEFVGTFVGEVVAGSSPRSASSIRASSCAGTER
jgi:hypothetical protein